MNRTQKTSRRYIQNSQVSTPVWQYFANVKSKLQFGLYLKIPKIYEKYPKSSKWNSRSVVAARWPIRPRQSYGSHFSSPLHLGHIVIIIIWKDKHIVIVMILKDKVIIRKTNTFDTCHNDNLERQTPWTCVIIMIWKDKHIGHRVIIIIWNDKHLGHIVKM